MSNETKQETIAELKARIEELEAKEAAQAAELDKIKAKEVGWLVTTDSPQYEGSSFGLRFYNGMCFIPKDAEVAYFKQTRSPDNVMGEYNESEREAIDKALLIPSSQRAVTVLVNEFGYHAEYFEADQSEELQKRMAARRREAAELHQKLGSPREQLEKIIQAHRM